MRRPKEDVLRFLIREVLNSRPAGSQEELSGLVRAELGKSDADFAITGERVRRIAVKIPGVRVFVSLRRGRVPSKCPCCFSGLRRIYTKNLKGKRILVGLRCRRCGYRGSGDKWVPRRYGFSKYLGAKAPRV